MLISDLNTFVLIYYRNLEEKIQVRLVWTILVVFLLGGKKGNIWS